MDHCGSFFARRDPKRFTQQMPASVDVPFALLVYAFRFTTIYMLALNVKCGCPSANRRFSYICPDMPCMYCPQTRHHGDASNAKFIKFCFCPQISHGVSQNIASKDSSALRLWQNRFAKQVRKPVFRPKARSQVVVNEQWTLPMGDLIACFFLLPLAHCNVRSLKMSDTFGRCQG